MNKRKLEQEFWDFVTMITLFFICTVIFAFTKLVPLAAVCWIIQFILFLLKRKKGE